MDATRPNDVGRPSHPQGSSQAGNVTTWHYDYESPQQTITKTYATGLTEVTNFNTKVEKRGGTP